MSRAILLCLQALYDIGCRSIMVAGFPPLGCGQGQNLIFTCLDPKNSDSQTYNIKLEELLPEIQAKLPGSKLVVSQATSHKFNKIFYLFLNFMKLLTCATNDLYIDFY